MFAFPEVTFTLSPAPTLSQISDSIPNASSFWSASFVATVTERYALQSQYCGRWEVDFKRSDV